MDKKEFLKLLNRIGFCVENLDEIDEEKNNITHNICAYITFDHPNLKYIRILWSHEFIHINLSQEKYKIGVKYKINLQNYIKCYGDYDYSGIRKEINQTFSFLGKDLVS